MLVTSEDNVSKNIRIIPKSNNHQPPLTLVVEMVPT